MVELKLDEEFSRNLKDKISKVYRDKPVRDGCWHVSDLLFPRYAVLNRKNPHVPTDDEIGFFFTGEAYHKFVQNMLGEHNSEVAGELFDITAHADYFDKVALVEFKTSRKWTVPDKPEGHYIEQLSMYCAIYGVNSGRICVIYPTAGRKWDGSASSTLEIVTWLVEFSDADIADIKDQMLKLRDSMNSAKSDGNIADLPFCPAWKCGSVEYDKDKKEYWIKYRCPFAKECGCNKELLDELDYRNDHRRKK